MIPVLLGSGIPLFSAGKRLDRLRLIGAKPYASGIAQLSYEVPPGRYVPQREVASTLAALVLLIVFFIDDRKRFGKKGSVNNKA